MTGENWVLGKPKQDIDEKQKEKESRACVCIVVIGSPFLDQMHVRKARADGKQLCGMIEGRQ